MVKYIAYDQESDTYYLTDQKSLSVAPLFIVMSNGDDEVDEWYVNLVITDLRRAGIGVYEYVLTICRITKLMIGLIIYKDAFVFARDSRLRNMGSLSDWEREIMFQIASDASDACMEVRGE